MPTPRVMGDAVILCDGTIGLFGGATQGIAVRSHGSTGCMAACMGPCPHAGIVRTWVRQPHHVLSSTHPSFAASNLNRCCLGRGGARAR